jgi:hypothetical protein
MFIIYLDFASEGGDMDSHGHGFSCVLERPNVPGLMVANLQLRAAKRSPLEAFLCNEVAYNIHARDLSSIIDMRV